MWTELYNATQLKNFLDLKLPPFSLHRIGDGKRQQFQNQEVFQLNFVVNIIDCTLGALEHCLQHLSKALELEHNQDKNGFYLTRFFMTIFLLKSLWESKSLKKSNQWVQMIDILLKYILWYESLNKLDAQSVFLEETITKKPVK